MNKMLAVLVLVGLPGGLPGQAIVEHAATSSAAAAGAAAMNGAAKKMNTALENAAKRLDEPKKAQSIRPTPVRTSAAPSPVRSAAPVQQALSEPLTSAVSYEDPAGIQVGMSYAELVRRFGQPATMVTSEEGGQTLWYAGKGSVGEVPVGMRDSKVVSVGAPAKASATGVVRPD